MKRTSLTIAAVATTLGVAFGSTAFAAGVTVSVGEPGFYGRLDLGDAPKPVLVNPNPVIIEHEHSVETPTYIYVPAEQRNNWANYCGKYEACGRPVYFVEDHWYNDVYVPAYKSKHAMKRDAKEDFRDAKRDAKEDKRDAKREYKDAKRDARDAD